VITQCVIPKSGRRFSDKITHQRKKNLEPDSTLSNQTLGRGRRDAQALCHQPTEAPAVQRAVEHVMVLRHHQARIKAARLLEAFRNDLRRAVQDRRRQVHVEEVAREQVAAEQKVVRRGLEAAMPERVAGEEHDPQATPGIEAGVG